jgi:MFS family permease
MSATAATASGDQFVETHIPARMDRLPWTKWHWRIIAALGTVWILDGLEVTIVGSISSRLQDKATLGLTEFQAIAQGSIYVAGACTGALFFGYLTDRLGRKKLFLWTLGLYLLATVATAFSQDFLMFAICRFFTGMGIGGEYAAINSAIDELIPARVRGWADLAINGSFWVGTAIAAAVSLLLLSDILPKDLGWRLIFGLGAVMALLILWVRRTLPESPRWLLTHGRADEAERIVGEIEATVAEQAGVRELREPEGEPLRVDQRKSIGFGEIARTLVRRYPKRTTLGLVLMAAQAFTYNAFLFSFGTILTKFFKVPDTNIGLYLLPFAVGNFLGPLLLGRFFDTVGRRIMIGGTFLISGVILAVSAALFHAGSLSATSLTAIWTAAFFFASAGASAGYLTVSEIFPMEIRAMAIAFFYAVATAIGGLTGPTLFGRLVDNIDQMTIGFYIAAGLMVIAAFTEFALGVDAEGETLENIATPLTAEGASREGAEPVERDRVGRGERFTRRAPQSQSLRSGGWSGMPQASLRSATDTDIDREISEIVRALDEADGPVARRELAERTGSRFWGAGRFSTALGTAMARGDVRRVGRGRYEATKTRSETSSTR